MAFDFRNPWNGKVESARVGLERYADGNLAVTMETFDAELQFWEPYCSVTVNLSEYKKTNENCAFVDTNNTPFITDVIIRNGFGIPTGRVGYSGFCMYPEFDFTKLIDKSA